MELVKTSSSMYPTDARPDYGHLDSRMDRTVKVLSVGVAFRLFIHVYKQEELRTGIINFTTTKQKQQQQQHSWLKGTKCVSTKKKTSASTGA